MIIQGEDYTFYPYYEITVKKYGSLLRAESAKTEITVCGELNTVNEDGSSTSRRIHALITITPRILGDPTQEFALIGPCDCHSEDGPESTSDDPRETCGGRRAVSF